MPTYEFNTPDGQKIDRSKLIACLNVGTKDNPDWAIIGKGVSSSSIEQDWQRSTETDILGNTTIDMKKPIKTQSFDPWPITKGDNAAEWVWQRGVVDEDAQALCNVDMLEVHMYASAGDSKYLAIRYESCSVEPNGPGGDGGGSLSMPINVTFGGTRTVGSVSAVGGKFVFSPDT